MGTFRNPQSGQVTLMHLLLFIALFMPLSGAVAELKHSHSGALSYLIALPASLALGVLIAWLDWKLGKAVWTRGQPRSPKVQDAVAVLLFVSGLLWIAIGFVSGIKIAVLATRVFPG